MLAKATFQLQKYEIQKHKQGALLRRNYFLSFTLKFNTCIRHEKIIREKVKVF